MTTINSPTAKPERIEDTTERTAQANVARLQRAVVKLAFSFHGQKGALDERLQRLGGLIKSTPKSSAVFALIDEIVDLIVAGGLSRGSTESATQQIGELLTKLQVPDDSTGEFREYFRVLRQGRAFDQFRAIAAGPKLRQVIHKTRNGVLRHLPARRYRTDRTIARRRPAACSLRPP